MADALSFAAPQPIQLPPGFGFDANTLPDLQAALARQQQMQRNPIAAGLASGYHSALGLAGSAAQGINTLIGSAFSAPDFTRTAQENAAYAAHQQAASEASGRPDLENAPWYSPTADLYRVAKLVPSIVPAALGGMATAGGGAALGIAGAALANLPLSVGSNVDAAVQANPQHQLTPADAAKAAGVAVPESIVSSLAPAHVFGAFGEHAAGSFLTRTLHGALTNAALGAVGSGANTALTQQAFTPDQPFADRAKDIVDSTIAGAAQAGLLGGMHAAFFGKGITPDAPTEALKAATDQLEPKPTEPPAPLALPAPREAPVATGGTIPVAPEAGQEFTPQANPYSDPKRSTASLVEEFKRLRASGNAPEQVAQIREALLERAPNPQPEPQVEAPAPQVEAPEPQAAGPELRLSASEPQAPAPEPTVAPAIAPDPGQRELFTPAATGERAAQADVERENIRASVGAPKNAEFINNLDVTNAPELVNALRAERDRLDQEKDGRFPAWFTKLTDTFGLTDETGKDVDLPARLADLQGRYKDLIEKVTDTKQGQKLLTNANDIKNNQIPAVQELIDLHKQADAISNRPGDVPPTVPDEMKETWQKLDAVARGDDPALAKRAQNVQLRIENDRAGADRAAKAAKLALNLANAKQRIPEPANVQRAPVVEEPVATRAPDGDAAPTIPAVPDIPVAPPAAREETPAQAQPAVPDQGVAANGKTFAVERGRVAPKEPAKQTQASIQADRAALRAKQAAEFAAVDAQAKIDRQARIQATLATRTPVVPLQRGDISKPKDFAAWREAQKKAAQEAIASDPNAPPAIRQAAEKDVPVGEPHPAIEAYQDAQKEMTSPASAPEPESVPPAPTPQWALDHAKDLQGETVYHTPDTALIRGQSRLTGAPVYVGVDRVTGRRTNADVGKYSGKLFSPEALADLRKARFAAIMNDAAAQIAAPDGPFTGATSSVVASANVDPRYKDYLSDLMRQVGLEKIRVFLSHPDDLAGNRDQYHLNNDYHSALAAGSDPLQDGQFRAFGPNYQDFHISLSPDLTPARSIEVISHEVGHLVQRVAFDDAPKAVQGAVKAEFEGWLKKMDGVNAPDFIKSLRNRETGLAQSEGVPENAHLDTYWKSFHEWFADNVSKWATSAEKPVGIVAKFFADVGQRLRQLVSAVTGNPYAPAETVADFMNKMGPGSADAWMTKKGLLDGSAQHSLRPPGERATPTIDETNRDAENLAVNAGAVKQSLDTAMQTAASGVKTLGAKIFEKALGFTHNNILVENFSHLFKQGGLDMQLQARKAGDNLGRLFSEMAHSPLANLAVKPPTLDRMNVIMRDATQLGFRHDMPWAQQPWLHDRPGLQPLVDKAFKDYNGFIRQEGGAKAMDQMLQAAQAERYAKLHRTLNAVLDAENRPEIARATSDPLRTYADNSAAHSSPELTLAHMKGPTLETVKGLQDYLDKRAAEAALVRPAKRGEPANPTADAAQFKAITTDTKDLQSALNWAKGEMTRMDQSSYFHLGRFGDHFVSAKLATDANGAPDPRALAALQDRLTKAGLKDISINQHIDNHEVFMRFDSGTQATNALKVVDGLIKDNLAGARSQGLVTDHSDMKRIAPEWVQRLITGVTNSDRFDKDSRDTIQRQLEHVWTDMMPARVLTQLPRDNTQGASTDMMRAYSYRMGTAANSLANLMSAKDINHAMGLIDADIQSAKDTGSHDETVKMQAIQKELNIREANRQWRPVHGVLDTFRAFTHAWFLGLSPAYFIVELSQLPMSVMPTLAKSHGFAASNVALAKSVAPAMRIIKQVAQSTANKDAIITADALRKSGVAPTVLDTVQRAVNRGVLTMGMTRNLGEAADPTLQNKVDRALHYANLSATYTELASHLMTVIAAHDLYTSAPDKWKGEFRGGKGLDAFIDRALAQGQGDYTQGNQPRQLGKHGFAGAYTPNLTQFSGWQVQMIERLYTEMHNVIAPPTAHPELRAEGARFLLGHLGVVAALSGTLGLPIAQTAMGAATKVANTLTGSDAFDVEGSYRSFLSTMLGKELGDAAARGLPHLGGVDFSDLGDQNLVPFGQFIADQRRWQDAAQSWSWHAMGSSMGLAGNIISGFEKIAMGDTENGLKSLLPSTLRNPYEAYQMQKYGYETNTGAKLLIQPSTADIVMKYAGIEPSSKVNLQDIQEQADRIKEGRKWVQSAYGGNFLRDSAHGNTEGARRNYDILLQHALANRGTALPNPLAPTQQAIESATSRAIRLPPGFSPMDMVARQRLSSYLTP